MHEVLASILCSFLGLNLSDVGIIEADVSDETSLRQMCANGKVLLNCVGPVRLLASCMQCRYLSCVIVVFSVLVIV